MDECAVSESKCKCGCEGVNKEHRKGHMWPNKNKSLVLELW